MKGRTIDFQPVCPATEMTLPRATVLCAVARCGAAEGPRHPPPPCPPARTRRCSPHGDDRQL